MTAGPASGRFVVLEHRWDGVHWDFMLEAGEASAHLGDRRADRAGDRPARAGLADHRLAYLDLRGAGLRERGEVRRVDAGSYRVAGVVGRPGPRGDPRAAQLVGEVDLWTFARLGLGRPRRPGNSAWEVRSEGPAARAAGASGTAPLVRSDRPARRIWPARISSSSSEHVVPVQVRACSA